MAFLRLHGKESLTVYSKGFYTSSIETAPEVEEPLPEQAMPAIKSPSNFTNAERIVARVISADPLNSANDNDIGAEGYIGPVADAVLRGDLSEAAMASLGRQLLQQYLRDVTPMVIAADADLLEAIEQVEDSWKRILADRPNHLLPRNGGL